MHGGDTIQLATARALERLGDAPAARDPNLWVDRRLGETLWSKQREIAGAVARYDNRIAVPSCHSAGKSMLAAWLVAWWVQAHAGQDSMVVTTAPTYAQVKSILWRYIRRTKGGADLDGNIVGSPLEAWMLGDTMVAFGRKPGGSHGKSGGDDEEAMATFQGLHADYLLTIMDEACGIPRWLWNAVESNSTGDRNVVLAIGNPDDSESQFAEVCQPDSGWTVIPIDAYDTPAFTGEEVPEKVRKALVQPAWVERQRQNWGEDSAMFQAKVRARFTAGSDDAVVPAGWISKCRYLDHDDIAALNPRGELPEGGVLGVDVARSEGGDDATIVQRHRGVVRVRWKGKVLPFEHGRHCADGQVNGVVPGLRDKVVELARAGGIDWTVVVDGDGVGGPLVDAVRSEHVGVHEFRAGAKPKRPNRFLNAKAEAWWDMRDLVKGLGVALPQGQGLPDQLAADLGAPRWHASNNRGLIQMESKDETKSRIGRSPDLGDACVMACWVPPVRVAPDAGVRAMRPRVVRPEAGIMEERW